MNERPAHDPERQAASPTRNGTDPIRTGWIVFAVLMALVLLEYVVAIFVDRNLPLMVIMNVTDAALIMYYFMHVRRLWGGEREES